LDELDAFDAMRAFLNAYWERGDVVEGREPDGAGGDRRGQGHGVGHGRISDRDSTLFSPRDKPDYHVENLEVGEANAGLNRLEKNHALSQMIVSATLWTGG